MKKYEFKNLVDVNTGKVPVVYGCGCSDCEAKYDRIKETGRQAVASFNRLMADDSGLFDNDVDIPCLVV